jgi:hypothetical protein
MLMQNMLRKHRGSRERLIDLDPLHVAEPPAGSVECGAHGRHGADGVRPEPIRTEEIWIEQ